MPLASEQKRSELISGILDPKSPMAKGLGHVGSDYNTAISRNNFVAAPKSQYESYALYAALPEITVAKMVNGKKQPSPMREAELREQKRDRDFLQRALKAEKEMPKRNLMWNQDRATRKESAPQASEFHKDTMDYLAQRRKPGGVKRAAGQTVPRQEATAAHPRQVSAP